MMKSLFLIAASALAVANASTTVSVLEFGKSGAVHRTLTKSTHTTVAGVSSFWSASASRGMQQADMTVVPDMFRKPDGAVVVGISGAGVDLESMPTVAALMQSNDQHVVGKMTLTGAQGTHLLHKAGPSTTLTSETLVTGVHKECHSHKLSSVHVKVEDSEKAASVDAQVAALIQSLSKTAGDTTIVVHLVVEEEEGAARRRLTSRRLEDEQNGENEDQNEGDGDEENANNNGNADANNGYYGYGYYDAYGNWVTPYKTMFQIQYFNIVLWTSVSLVVLLFYVIYKMVDMPMEADTLLFGESAKMMGD